jgi:hypothetical protein
MSMKTECEQVTESRLRMTQELLIAAMDSNPALLMNPRWQEAMAGVTRLLQERRLGRDDPNQLTLFGRLPRGAAQRMFAS